jgi:Ca2+-binding RTX toxin-like protein
VNYNSNGVALSVPTYNVCHLQGNYAYGTAAEDLLYGNDGNNYLNGYAGVDLLQGGKGSDIYFVDNLRDEVFESEAGGQDEIRSDANYILPNNVENLWILNGIYGTGNSLDNLIRGNASSNTLSGLLGNDTLYGYGGNDLLSGGYGNDRLIGGAGADLLRGGPGADVFVFQFVEDSIASLYDTIEDFSFKNGDKIDLRAIDAKAGTASNDAFVWLGAYAPSASNAKGALWTSGGYVYGSVDGDTQAEFVIYLKGISSSNITKYYFLL